MAYKFPAGPARVTQDGTAIEVHQFLKYPELITKSVQELTDHGFIADFILQGRYNAVGGSILYETGEEIFAVDAPEAVAPGAEFPATSMTTGQLKSARTTKWGLDSPVTDESISRMLFSPVDKAIQKLANSVIRHVDSVALGVIASQVQATVAATAPWEGDAKAIIKSVMVGIARRERELVGQAFDFNTVILDPVQHAIIVSELLNSGQLRDTGANAIGTGEAVNILGKTWVTSPHVPFSDPFVVDRNQLGGMAEENIESPGYSRTGDGVGVETKAIRDDKRELYDLRARRVTVPVILEPSAGFRIINTGL